MSGSRQALQLGPVVAAIVVIAGLGIVLPLYLAYEFDRDAPAEVDVSDDQADTRDGESREDERAIVTRLAANREFPVSDPFDDPTFEREPAESERASIHQSISERDATSPPVFEFDQTSWEAPFDSAYWKATGWKFDSAGMLSEGEESSATFRRAYEHFMFECQIEPQDDATGPLRVHLKGSQANSVMTLAIDGARLVVTDDSRIPPAVIKEESVSPAATNGEPVRLKLAATGNRLIVSWNGVVALTCNQIAGQSGRPVRFVFAADSTPWGIRDLRIEGE